MKKEKITKDIIGKFAIKDVVSDNFATEADSIEGFLSFLRLPAVFNTEDDAKKYLKNNGCLGNSNYMVNRLVHTDWSAAILVTFNDETDTTIDDIEKIVDTLRTIREVCKEHTDCKNCMFGRVGSGCSITEIRPDRWVLVGDDPKEANKLFVN